MWTSSFLGDVCDAPLDMESCNFLSRGKIVHLQHSCLALASSNLALRSRTKGLENKHLWWFKLSLWLLIKIIQNAFILLLYSQLSMRIVANLQKLEASYTETSGNDTNLTFHCHVINQYHQVMRTSMMALGLDYDRFWMAIYSLK